MTVKRYAGICLLSLSLLLFLLFLAFSKTAYQAAYEGLITVGKTVIPVLLPYTVLSNVISDALQPKDRKNAILTAFIIGNVCGAPIGASAVGRLYTKGIITKKEAGLLLPAVSCASPAFCISAVGTVLFKNTNFGILMWTTQLLINIVLLAVYFHTFKSYRISEPAENNLTIDPADIISRSTATLCSVTVSVMFFTVLSDVISDFFNLTIKAKCILNSVLEMCGGCKTSASLNNGASFLTSAFALGFGGISVLAQISSCTKGIKKYPYVIIKLATGVCCVLITLFNRQFSIPLLKN